MERQVHILGEPEINAYLFTAVPTLYVQYFIFSKYVKEYKLCKVVSRCITSLTLPLYTQLLFGGIF